MNIKKFLYKLLSVIPDKPYLKMMFIIKKHKFLHLKNPKTFNEKMQWLKLYDRKKEYSKMVDKFEAKKYVQNIIGKQYIIPTLGIYENFDEINFDKLPNQFVIKCTHDSSGIVICSDKNKLDIVKAKKRINNSFSYNYYINGREWPYKNVKPRIIVEKYMGDNLTDYKIFCCNGIPAIIEVHYDRYNNHKSMIYKADWEKLDASTVNNPKESRDFERPKRLEEMINISKKLSKGKKFVRVDLYEIDGIVYFGELTFYPGSGYLKFNPKELDRKLGNFVNLDKD